MAHIDDAKRIHLIGIGGCSMNGLALILKSLGHEVTGSDRERTQFADNSLKYQMSLSLSTLAGVFAIHKQESAAGIGIKAQLLSHPLTQHIATQGGAFEHIQNAQRGGFTSHVRQVRAAGQGLGVNAQC